MRVKIIASSLAIQIALGIILLTFPHVLWVAIVLLALTLFLTAALIISVVQRRKRVRALHEAVEKFLHEGKEPTFSLKEDEYSDVENDICELAHLLIKQKESVIQEHKKTADFIADVSHQLKTPLTSLKLYCEMQNGKYAKKQLPLIERMEKLIYSLLRLQKLRAGAYDMTFLPHDIAQLIGGVWSELEVIYPKKQLQISGNALGFRCDEYWLSEAIENILKNACEHTKDCGNILVTIEQTDKSLNIAIEDDGGGMPEAELVHLFRRFYRSSTQRSGTGLGLAITRTIAEKHHGSIEARNTPQGLCITMCFPILDGVLAIS